MREQVVVSIYVLGAAPGTPPKVSVTVVCPIPECGNHVAIAYHVGEERDHAPFAACTMCGNMAGLTPAALREVRLKIK